MATTRPPLGVEDAGVAGGDRRRPGRHFAPPSPRHRPGPLPASGRHFAKTRRGFAHAPGWPEADGYRPGRLELGLHLWRQLPVMVRVSLQEMRAHKLRLALMVTAVASSVALMTGTQILTATVTASFDRVFAQTSRLIDVEVRSAGNVNTGLVILRSPVDASVVSDISGVNGVQAVEGRIQNPVAILDVRGAPLRDPNVGQTTYGMNWTQSPALNGWRIAAGRPPQTSGEVVLDQRTAHDGAYRLGDRVGVQTSFGVQHFVLVGTARFGSGADYAGASAALFATPTAQQIFGMAGGEVDGKQVSPTFNSIEVAAQHGVTPAEVRSRIAPLLGPGLEAVTRNTVVAENESLFQNVFRTIGWVLLVFGIVASLVGAFIIHNTFRVIVAQRMRQVSLLRALGASRGQVLRSIALEALVLGILASIAGAIAGIVLALEMTSLVRSGAVQGAAAGALPSGAGFNVQHLALPPLAFVIAIAIGVVITVASAWRSAWEASKVPPVAAMQAVDAGNAGGSSRRLPVSAAVAAVGALGVLSGLYWSRGMPLAEAGGGTALLVIAVVATAPSYARPFSRMVGSPLRWFTGRLGRANAMRNPARTAATASALTISVGLIVMFGVLVQSIRGTVNHAVDATVAASLVVDSTSNGLTGFDQFMVATLASTPGVSSVTPIKFGSGEVGGKLTQILAADPGQINRAFKVNIVAGDLRTMGPDQIAVDRDTASAHRWKVGSPIPTSLFDRTMTVGAVYEVHGLPGGVGAFLTITGFDRQFPNQQFQSWNQIYLGLAPGTDLRAATAQVHAAVAQRYPTAQVYNIAGFKKSRAAIFNVLLVMIGVMLVLATAIGMLGIVNTMLLAVHERRREIGLLRAVGCTRDQVRSMVCCESVIYTVEGTVTGALVGLLSARGGGRRSGTPAGTAGSVGAMVVLRVDDCGGRRGWHRGRHSPRPQRVTRHGDRSPVGLVTGWFRGSGRRGLGRHGLVDGLVGEQFSPGHGGDPVAPSATVDEPPACEAQPDQGLAGFIDALL